MEADGPLTGVRVIDASTVVMGPWATHFLAGYGADVVKVEPPGGDIIRTAGAARNPGMGSVFLASARGKRSVVLDLKRPGGRDALLRLLDGADAFVHNVRPAAMARLRLTSDSLVREFPRLIVLDLVGYGSAGPYASLPAYDDLMQGASGLAAQFVASANGAPRYVPALIADRYVGVCAANALLAALVARASSGRGRAIEIAMFETMVELVCSDHLGGETFVPAIGPPGYARLLARDRRPYRTADGYIGLLLYDERHWRTFFALVGASERYERDLRLSDRAQRMRDYDYAYGEVAAILAQRSTREWLATLRAADLPVTAINDVAALLEHEHLVERDFFGYEEHPSEGTLRTFGTSSGAKRPAPRLGEHTREVLCESGYADAEIDRLIAAGAASEASASAANPARTRDPDPS